MFNARLAPLSAMLIAAIGCIVTWGYWHAEEAEVDHRAEQALHLAADKISLTIDQRLRSYELALRGVKGFFESSQNVSPAEYHRYIDALQLPQTRPGLQAVVFIQHVLGDELGAHSAQQRAQGFAGYQVRPAGRRVVHAPVVMIEPTTSLNMAVIGSDLATNPVIRAALEAARDTGEATLTDKLTLVQDVALGDEAPAALVLYVPIYNPKLPTLTVAERRTALMGWTSGPFRITDLISSLAPQLDADIHIAMYQGTDVTAANLLYRSEQAHVTARVRSVTRELSTGGKRTTLVLTTQPGFDQRFATEEHGLVATIGASLSLLLGVVTWLLMTSRERARALAHTMTQDLQRTQAEHESVLNALPDALFEMDLAGHYLHYHTPRLELLAAPPAAFLGKLITDVLPAPAAATCMAALQEANETGFSFGREIEIQTGEGLQWFELSVARKTDTPADDPQFVVLSRKITARKEAERQLALSAQVFNAAHESGIVTDADNRIVAVNAAFTALSGYTAAEVLGQKPSLLKSGLQDTEFYIDMWHSIRNSGVWQGEVWNRRKDGTLYAQWLSISTVRDVNGHITQHIAMMSDLTANKAAQQRIDYLAHYDALTGLPNSVLLQDRGAQALTSAQRKQNTLALLAIDLDRFQKINDSLGLPVGDSVLKAVAKRLLQHLHSDDTLSRQSGDEFTLLLPDTTATGAAHVAQKLLDLLTRPLVLDEHDLQSINLTASIGIALFPENGSDFGQLQRAAYAALHRAKQDAGNRFAFFKENMHTAAREALQIENELHRAIGNHELQLHYQPQVDAKSGRIIGAEALIRWQHPDWGLVSPARFIPVAEKSGLIAEVGQWVLHTAVQQQAEWAAGGLEIVPVAINLSALEFKRDSLCETVQKVLSRSDLPAAMLELELTETVAMEDTDFTVRQIKALHALGVKLSIDDFGTGYSSLSYLKRYQIDKLKIDQSFIRDIDKDVSDSTIVSTIIALAHGLGFKTIAEGVETAEQLAYLQAHGCDEIQGYYFSRPIPAVAFAELLGNGGVLSMV